MKRIRYTILFASMVFSGAAFAEVVPVATQGVLAPATATTDRQVLSVARELIDSGKAGKAYELLSPLEFDRAGDPEFDYLLGIAALESGQPDLATLALERVLIVAPADVAARMDIARAYFQLGDMTRARSEFNVALQQNTDPASRATIHRYLSRIDAGGIVKPTRVTGYIQGGLGRNSNANNATSQPDIVIPFAGNVVATLDPTNVKTSANYYDAAAGVNAVHDLDKDWGVYGGADLSQRGYSKFSNFDARYLSAHAGVLLGKDEHHFRIGLNVGRYDLGRVRNRDNTGLDAEWRYMIDASNQMNIYAQTMSYRYANPTMQLNDFNQQLAGVAWQHAYDDSGSAVSLSLYHGREGEASKIINPTTLTAGRSDGAKLFNGVRIGAQMAYADDLMLSLSGGGLAGSYSRTNPYFLVQRYDKQADMTLAADWHYAQLWTLRPQLSYVYNKSNIVIYRFNRFDAGVVLRRDFK